MSEPFQQAGAPLWRMLLAQTKMELRLTLRRGESVLVTLVVPGALLAFFATLPLGIDTLRLGASSDTAAGLAQVLLPGILALSVMSTAMVSLGIATAFERQYGVLKRLGGTPLPRPALLGAKIASVLVIEALQVAEVLAIALALGWRPEGNLPLAAAAIILGTAAFGGAGLWMAGSWRAEATLAGANGLYLLLLLFGGLVVPVEALPPGPAAIAGWLPSAALAGVLRAALLPEPARPPLVPALGILLLWAVAMPALAARTFRWE
jgi:ABC-2 type transport system permease protein